MYKLIVNIPLDRESTPDGFERVTVSCEDHGNPPREKSETLLVKLIFF